MTDRPPAPIGVLLAAGRGRRLGGGKQLLPVAGAHGDVPLVAAAFDAIGIVCGTMIVVVGHRADDVTAALGDRTFRRVDADPDAEMMASARTGLAEAATVAPEAPVLLHPADHPSVPAGVLEALLGAGTDARRAWMPEHEGRGGHPVLIGAALVPDLLAWRGPGGLRRYWEIHPDRCVRLPVDDPAVVRDLDDPAAYRALRGEGPAGP